MSAEPGTLDEAWAEAEAVLPSGWALTVRHNPGGTWMATATVQFRGGPIRRRITESKHRSQASALHALADVLRAVPT